MVLLYLKLCDIEEYKPQTSILFRIIFVKFFTQPISYKLSLIHTHEVNERMVLEGIIFHSRLDKSHI